MKLGQKSDYPRINIQIKKRILTFLFGFAYNIIVIRKKEQYKTLKKKLHIDVVLLEAGRPFSYESGKAFLYVIEDYFDSKGNDYWVDTALKQIGINYETEDLPGGVTTREFSEILFSFELEDIRMSAPKTYSEFLKIKYKVQLDRGKKIEKIKNRIC